MSDVELQTVDTKFGFSRFAEVRSLVVSTRSLDNFADAIVPEISKVGRGIPRGRSKAGALLGCKKWRREPVVSTHNSQELRA